MTVPVIVFSPDHPTSAMEMDEDMSFWLLQPLFWPLYTPDIRLLRPTSSSDLAQETRAVSVSHTLTAYSSERDPVIPRAERLSSLIWRRTYPPPWKRFCRDASRRAGYPRILNGDRAGSMLQHSRSPATDVARTVLRTRNRRMRRLPCRSKTRSRRVFRFSMMWSRCRRFINSSMPANVS